MAWRMMLGQEGAINSFLEAVGLISEPLDLLLYSRAAVMITLTYVWIPFAALPIYAALLRIEPAVMEAAFDLGASPVRRFLRVVLPISRPGVVAAFFMVFIPTVGEYVTPLLIGGSSGSMYGNIVQDFFTKAANWPLGSALAMVMLAGTLVAVVLAALLIDVRRLVEQ
jgi:spermidine/putrescine transport system permease protein